MKKFNSPLDAFSWWAETTPENIFLRQPINRKFIEYSYDQVNIEAREMANALLQIVNPGDHVAILSKNCAHWFMADLAIMMAGCISIPIYPTLDAEGIQSILEHSETKGIIIGKLDDYSAQQPGITDIPRIGVELYGIKEQYSWEKLIEENEPLENIHKQSPEELMTIMYTSGTTGSPKGVMHKVSSFTLLVNTYIDIFDWPENMSYFSYLPLTHIAERGGLEMPAIFFGATVSFAESLETFAQDLASVQPVMFFGVPRIWQKFKEKVNESIPEKKLNRLLKIPLLNTFIKKKIKNKLGLSNSIFNASGAAPLSPEIINWYKKIGVSINQVYGMTEDCILSHYNMPDTNRIGSVGKPLPGVTSKLSPEGEILIKSDALMLGYYKKAEKTVESFTDDGFLKTGDIGEFDHDGYLYITGRSKDQFKTDKGKYVHPGPLESKLSMNTAIEQVCIVGTGIAQPIALVILSESGKKMDKKVLEDSIVDSIKELNKSAQKHEKVEKAVIMKEEWSVDNGLMTPTMKIKRNRIEEIHQHMYPEWFNSPENVVYES
ncbi:AMP-binding protein [Mangrovivirga sp. M17]|uniref:AMP-binding protein n=1 Tax=Mangrovivirga halotolerans TaxID=2993936 RepID=A0ABT3RQS7_9BACT|nr:AMP-binding protein [Mangrovivirga halotolerans]MCX2744131.1 AMP-binding protein [Mangrovivirga halotolerans]